MGFEGELVGAVGVGDGDGAGDEATRLVKLGRRMGTIDYGG